MIAKNLFEVDGPHFFADGDNHEAECWRLWTAHRGCLYTVECIFGPEQTVCMFNADLRDIFDADLPGDVESTEGAALDDVAWIVSLSWIN